MTPLELSTHVKMQLDATVRVAAADTALRLRKRTPANRRRTRRAISFSVNGHRATVGLNFSQRYPADGTTTQQQFEAAWRQIRPVIRQQITDQLNSALKDN